MTINVAININGVLAMDSVDSLEQAAFFKNKGAIITAGKAHCLFPGAIEFLKLLFQTENVKVSFYHDDKRIETKELVKQIMELALGEKSSEMTVGVFSKEDFLTNQEGYKSVRRKDLIDVLDVGDSIEDAVLIDHDLSSLKDRSNLLLTKETDNDTFGSLSWFKAFYSKEGEMPLNCCLMIGAAFVPEQIRDVKRGKSIAIIKAEEGFTLSFMDEHSTKHIKENVSLETHKELAQNLTKVFEQMIKGGDKFQIIDDKKVVEQIYDFVASHQGKTKTICRQVNRIYHIAGLFFSSLIQANESHKPITAILSKIQFDKDGWIKPGSERDEYYFCGLNHLRKINPTLSFTNPHDYDSFIKSRKDCKDWEGKEELSKIFADQIIN